MCRAPGQIKSAISGSGQRRSPVPLLRSARTWNTINTLIPMMAMNASRRLDEAACRGDCELLVHGHVGSHSVTPVPWLIRPMAETGHNAFKIRHPTRLTMTGPCRHPCRSDHPSRGSPRGMPFLDAMEPAVIVVMDAFRLRPEFDHHALDGLGPGGCLGGRPLRRPNLWQCHKFTPHKNTGSKQDATGRHFSGPTVGADRPSEVADRESPPLSSNDSSAPVCRRIRASGWRNTRPKSVERQPPKSPPPSVTTLSA